ncbi:MAG: folylpolyglutamate synthase/dihydrofolate synthase family protein [Gemella sp.]|nr:folylpolyglutamate synthase/dihydrofolate synthase family protein [Gemella sp.]
MNEIYGKIYIDYCQENNITVDEQILNLIESDNRIEKLATYREREEVAYILEKMCEDLVVESISKMERSGIKLGLHRMFNMLEVYGNPQKDMKVIHIAGTNGKGSTSAYLKNVLSSKYRVGMYSSPSMVSFNDRIRINDEFISFFEMYSLYKDIENTWKEKFASDDDKLSVFETLTLVGILYFAKEKPDFIIMEVGLGGKYDATNIFSEKLLSIITKIGLDHTNLLGNSIDKIAYEKAGIIQENDSVVVYPSDKEALEIIKKEVEEKNAILNILDENDINIEEIGLKSSKFSYKDYKNIDIKMLGQHQIYNASLALMALDNLKERKLVEISNEEIKEGLANTIWLGRLEWIKENILIDGAHNVDGVTSLVKYLSSYKNKKIKLLVGILADKDFSQMIDLFETLPAEFYVTRVPMEIKEASLDNLAEAFTKDVTEFENYKEAVDKLVPNIQEDEVLVVTGSLYLISEVRKYIL